jgi:hypothetical protein
MNTLLIISLILHHIYHNTYTAIFVAFMVILTIFSIFRYYVNLKKTIDK